MSETFRQIEADVAKTHSVAASNEIGVVFLQLPNDLSGQRVLEIGSGICSIMANVKARGADVLGIDFAYSNIPEFLQRTIQEKSDFIKNPPIQMPIPNLILGEKMFEDDIENFRRNYKDLNLTAAIAGSLPFQDGSFDTAYSMCCVTSDENLDHPEVVIGMMEEIARVLKKGGSFWASPVSAKVLPLLTRLQLMGHVHIIEDPLKAGLHTLLFQNEEDVDCPHPLIITRD